MKKLQNCLLFLLTCLLILEPSMSLASKGNVHWVDSAIGVGSFQDGMAEVTLNAANDFRRAFVDSYGNIVTSDLIPGRPFKDGVGYLTNSWTHKLTPINRKGEDLTLVDNQGQQLNTYVQDGIFGYGYGILLTDIYGRRLTTYLYEYVEPTSPDFLTGVFMVDGPSLTGSNAFNYKGETILKFEPNSDKFLSSYRNRRYKNLIEAVDRNTMKYGYYDYNGKLVIPFICDETIIYSEGKYAVSSNGKSGYMDSNGKIITPFLYDYATEFKNGFGVVFKNMKQAVVNKDGKLITGLIYDNVDYYNKSTEDMIVVVSNNKYGFVNQDGKSNISCQFDYANGFVEGLAAVKKGNKWGYINKAGKTIIPFNYDYAYDFMDGYAKVQIGDKYGMINKNGNLVIPAQYIDLYKLHVTFDLKNYHYLATTDKYNTAIYDKNLKLLIPGNYSFNTVYSPNEPESQWVFSMRDANRKIAIFGTDGKQRTEFKYDQMSRFAFGVASFVQDGKCGLIDVNGKEILPPIYELVSLEERERYNINLIKVKLNGKYGLVEANGDEFIPAEYDEIRMFSEGITWVKKDNKWGIVKDTKKYSDMSNWSKDNIEKALNLDLVPYECDGFYTNTITRLQFASLVTNLAEKVTGKRIVPASIGQFKDTKADAALRAYNAGIINGSGNDNTFAPNDGVTREQAATMLYRTIKYIEKETGKKIISGSKSLDSYTDQSKVSSWAKEAISALAGSGVMEGTSKTTLSPSNNTSIEEAISLVLRIFNNL